MTVSNSFKNTDLVTKFAMKAFLNALMLGKKVDRQLDEKNVYSGKNGETIRVRRPVYFTASDGAEIEAGETSQIEEGVVSVVADTRKKVVMAIPTADMTLRVENGYERYIVPAMEELAQQVESDIADQYKYFYNFVGTPGTSPGTFLSVGAADAKLTELGVPMSKRCAFYGPQESVALADGLKGVFPEKISALAIEEAAIGRYSGFDIYKNQSLKIHTVGVATGTPLVNGASQGVTYAASKDTWSQSLITDGWTNSQTGILKAGDVFTIAGVYSVNRRTRESTGSLAQFTVLVDADSDGSGDSVPSISPPIITSGPYKTVNAAPANDAAIVVKTGATLASHRQNIAFHPNAITLAVIQLELPTDGATSSRVNKDGISLRLVRQYDSTSDVTRTRVDIQYAIKTQNPGFGVRTTS